MKKLLLILLTGILVFSLSACSVKPENQQGSQVDNSHTENEQDSQIEENVSRPIHLAYDTFIQDGDGVDRCFWGDGKVVFDDFGGRGRQIKKSATLTVSTEYDMWFADLEIDLDLTNDYYPIEFEYDETKIEITENPDKENHFIIKVLQSCDNEEIFITLTSKSPLDEMFDENGEPCSIPHPCKISVTISTVE
ncbi:MAG: hypothetical protein HDT28_03205 [Clostridiales bacterium]|nr:hypothetical protein [Clostridiales bacterium]